jgi:hypothetical protein
MNIELSQVTQMVNRKTPRPLRTAFTDHSRVQRPQRDYALTSIAPGGRPIQDFDWDHALTLHALAMWSLGYQLSEQQKLRIEDYGRDN